MNRIAIQELSTVFFERFNMSKSDAQHFVTTFFKVIQEGLESDGLVKVNGLGTFKIVNVDDRESVNVNTSERVVIEGHQKISFLPDSLMKEMVNKPFSGFETVVINDGVAFEEISDLSADAEDDDEEESEDECMDEVEEPEVENQETEADVSAAPLLNFDEEESTEPETIVEPETVAEPAPQTTEEVAEEPVVAEEEEPIAEKLETEAEPDEEIEEERSRWPLWAAACVACLLSFGIGYWFGLQKAQPKVEEAIVAEKAEAKLEKDSIVKAAEKPADTIEVRMPEAKPAMAEVKQSEEKPATAEVKQSEEKPDMDKYAAMDVRIRTGAYRIVGTQTTVKVRPGMTIKKIARQQIGEELACYIAAYNDMKENDSLTVGQEIKIPKLEWKKKSKAKDNKQ